MKVQKVGNGNSYITQQQEPIIKVMPEGAGLPEATVFPPGQTEGKEGLDRQKLVKAVDNANKIMETYNTELHFSIHEASGEMMVKIVSKKDNSVIREIPPEHVLNFVAHVKKMLGLMLDKFI